jgi:hypothetical protein
LLHEGTTRQLAATTGQEKLPRLPSSPMPRPTRSGELSLSDLRFVIIFPFNQSAIALT